MLSTNEMKRLRRAHRYSRWSPLLFGLLLFLQLFGAAARFYIAQSLCSRAALPWSRAAALAFQGFDIHETYSGIVIRCASLIQNATLYLFAAVITVIFYFASRVHQRRDIALLHYAEQETQRG